METNRLYKIYTIIRRNGFLPIARRSITDPSRVIHFLRTGDAGAQVIPNYPYEAQPQQEDVRAFTMGLFPNTAEEKVDETLKEIREDTTFQKKINCALQSTKEGPEGYFYNWRELLYVICRLENPGLVVETGVRGGLSSSYILNALEKNNQGKLLSIDIGDKSILPHDVPNREIGWLIPNDLRPRWNLRIGDSRTLLPTIFEENTVNIFFSDVPNEVFGDELQTSGQFLDRGSIAISSYLPGSDSKEIWDAFSESYLQETYEILRWKSDTEVSRLCAGRAQ